MEDEELYNILGLSDTAYVPTVTKNDEESLSSIADIPLSDDQLSDHGRKPDLVVNLDSSNALNNIKLDHTSFHNIDAESYNLKGYNVGRDYGREDLEKIFSKLMENTAKVDSIQVEIQNMKRDENKMDLKILENTFEKVLCMIKK